MTTLRVFPSSKILGDKALHNLINVKVRHCRVGNVKLKDTVDNRCGGEKDPYRYLSE